MLIAIDTETQGLDATGTKFILGCILQENNIKHIHTNRKAMYEHIIELGKKEKKRGHILNVYAHNMEYDFYNIVNIEDKHLRIISSHPFIAKYVEWEKKEYHGLKRNFEKEMKGEKVEIIENNKKELKIKYKKEKTIIHFLDSMAFYRMSLKKIGEIIGIPKLEMPKELQKKNNKKRTKEEIEKIAKYCIQDTKIVLEAIKLIKRKLKEEGMTVRILFTMSQIAVKYFMKELKETKGMENLFYDKSKKGLYWTKNNKKTISICNHKTRIWKEKRI